MSISMSATNTVLRALRTKRGLQQLVQTAASREYPPPAATPRSITRRFAITETVVRDRPVLTLTPKTGATGQQLVYTHGGAYVGPLLNFHWWILDRATRDTGATVTIPLYHLAPEGDVTDGYTMLRDVYQPLADDHGAGNITLAGDSAGGGLALGQAITYRDDGIGMPRQVILLSPWLDITMSNPVIAALQPHDPMLDAAALVDLGKLWARDRDPRGPQLSPLFADLANLPPVHIVQGGNDVFAADAQLLAQRLADAGNNGTNTFAPAGFHVYPAAFWTPEGRAALSAINSLLTPGHSVT
jgi:monoterpene epsilon-lactone hydrolase